ncbi:hypothetical protein [Paratractidigestivibacter sp.]|uniref:hypothetical protein n=1 Tax=Paratractidigestivibacter sp. TaxID=2847316 RepID=UPI002AC916BC|nr:hypothetical protein [Paratractidigestivibacter sp.]
MEFEEARRRALAFRGERGWAQFHNPIGLAASISIEASELLECFQWPGSDTSFALREELAGVMLYAIYPADAIGGGRPANGRRQGPGQRR